MSCWHTRESCGAARLLQHCVRWSSPAAMDHRSIMRRKEATLAIASTCARIYGWDQSSTSPRCAPPASPQSPPLPLPIEPQLAGGSGSFDPSTIHAHTPRRSGTSTVLSPLPSDCDDREGTPGAAQPLHSRCADDTVSIVAPSPPQQRVQPTSPEPPAPDLEPSHECELERTRSVSQSESDGSSEFFDCQSLPTSSPGWQGDQSSVFVGHRMDLSALHNTTMLSSYSEDSQRRHVTGRSTVRKRRLAPPRFIAPLEDSVVSSGSGASQGLRDSPHADTTSSLSNYTEHSSHSAQLCVQACRECAHSAERLTVCPLARLLW